MKTFKELMEKIKEPTGDLKKACWKGYTAIGMKMKNGRKVPNCVPEEVELDEANPQGMSDREYARHELGKGKKPEVKVGAKVTVDGGGSGIVQKVYDKELSNGQKRKFIHLKDHKGRDFHHRYYAHRVKVMEDVEQIDELSKDTLKSYVKKAVPDMQNSQKRAEGSLAKSNSELDKGNESKAKKHYSDAEAAHERTQKRMAGIAGAIRRVKANEEVENPDELSKKTLGSYIKQAAGGMKGLGVSAHQVGSSDNPTHKEKMWKRALKREKGISMAADKLTKEEVELDEMQGDDYNQGGWNHDPYDYNKGKWPRANTLKNKEWQKVSKKIATRLADKLIDRKKARKVNEEVTLDEMSKLSDALAKIKHDFENPPADHKDAKPAPAKKPEPKKGGGMDYYPDSHGGRRYMGDSVEMDGETIAESNEENARAKVRETHSQILKKGYKYIGSEQRSVGKDDSLVTHNYLSKDGSHIHHMQYSPYTMTGKGGPHIFHKKTKFNAKLHDHLTEQCFNYFDEASSKAGKNVVPPTAGTIGSIGGLVREEESENKPLGKVMRAGDGKKKFKVYVKNAKGNTVKVGFGDPNMEIKRDDPERRKNFRARHNCATATDRTTPRYWSCRQWRSSAKVEA